MNTDGASSLLTPWITRPPRPIWTKKADAGWGAVTSDWGFGQACTARDGSYLLLRGGDVVALIGATGLDLTGPEYLEAIRARTLG